MRRSCSWAVQAGTWQCYSIGCTCTPFPEPPTPTTPGRWDMPAHCPPLAFRHHGLPLRGMQNHPAHRPPSAFSQRAMLSL